MRAELKQAFRLFDKEATVGTLSLSISLYRDNIKSSIGSLPTCVSICFYLLLFLSISFYPILYRSIYFFIFSSPPIYLYYLFLSASIFIFYLSQAESYTALSIYTGFFLQFFYQCRVLVRTYFYECFALILREATQRRGRGRQLKKNYSFESSRKKPEKR